MLACIGGAMKVLRIVAEGLTTSFRYPHFMLGVQPTFEMPPPATIYGHICSALGYWFDPAGVAFAYHFTWKAKFDDVEHTHILAPASGKLPGTQYAKAVEGAVNPYKRSILFQPRLVLYLNQPDWEGAFRSPRYATSLGRSQDLFTYTKIDVVDLAEADSAYFEHTLAPFTLSMRMAKGYSVLMPRFLDYHNHRAPRFDQYVVVKQRAYTEEDYLFVGAERFIIDPDSPSSKGAHLGMLFHTFVEEA